MAYADIGHTQGALAIGEALSADWPDDIDLSASLAELREQIQPVRQAGVPA